MKLLLIPVIFLVLLIPTQAFAVPYNEQVTTYSGKFFAIITGDYNTKNGAMKLSGLYKYGNYELSDLKVIGQLKYWDMYDSSIPNCKHAFSNGMIILFDKNKSNANMVLKGKLCSANWSDSYQTLRADYYVINGKTPSTDSMSGKGVLELTIHMPTGKIINGKLNGNIILYT